MKITNKILKQYISHWAMLPMSEFEDDTSLKSLRIDFGMCSKIAMIISATFNDASKDVGTVKFADDDVILLDTVNDFVKFFKDKKLKIVNPAPKGYE